MAGAVVCNGGKPAYAFESITVSTTAIGITSTLVHQQSASAPTRDARFAVITVESQPLRYRIDGTNPDASTGHLLAAGDVLTLDNFDDIRRLRMIRSGASDSTAMVTLF